jgi:hypothetical protein
MGVSRSGFAIRIQEGKNDQRPTKIGKSSVADPGCLSRILIFTDPGSRISDPKTATKERGEILVFTFFVANFTKL